MLYCVGRGLWNKLIPRPQSPTKCLIKIQKPKIAPENNLCTKITILEGALSGHMVHLSDVTFYWTYTHRLRQRAMIATATDERIARAKLTLTWQANNNNNNNVLQEFLWRRDACRFKWRDKLIVGVKIPVTLRTSTRPLFTTEPNPTQRLVHKTLGGWDFTKQGEKPI
jgi:hypothetical protein